MMIRNARAMTLVEVVCAIVVIGVVAAVVLPVIGGATDAYAGASATRSAVESVAYAVERAARLLRDAPPGASEGTLGIAAATPTSVVLSDGRGLELDGATLLLRAGPADTSPLCRGVTVFELTYLSRDGVTSAAGTPSATHRINIRLAAAGAELRTSVFPRVGLVP